MPKLVSQVLLDNLLVRHTYDDSSFVDKQLSAAPEADTSKIKEYKIQASKKARESGGSMRVEENNLLGDILSQMGYDAIEYDNKGESGGSAVILWDPAKIKIVKKETI